MHMHMHMHTRYHKSNQHLHVHTNKMAWLNHYYESHLRRNGTHSVHKLPYKLHQLCKLTRLRVLQRKHTLTRRVNIRRNQR